MTTTHTPALFTALPDEETLVDTVVALEGRGLSVEVVEDPDAARDAILALIPIGSSVMTNTSVTLPETGSADAIADGGRYKSARGSERGLDDIRAPGLRVVPLCPFVADHLHRQPERRDLIRDPALR